MLQSVAIPETLAQAHALLAGAGGAVLAGGTALMPVVNQGVHPVTSTRQPAQGRPLRRHHQGRHRNHWRHDDAVRPRGQCVARLSLARRSMRSRRRRSATWRPSAAICSSGSPMAISPACLVALAATATMATQHGDPDGNGGATGRVRRRAGRDRHQPLLRHAAARHVQIRQGRAQGAERGGHRDGRGRRDDRRGPRRRHAASRLAAWRAIAVRARSVEAALAGRPFDRAHVAAAAAEADRRHRPLRRCLCQRLVPRARHAGAHPPRPDRRVAQQRHLTATGMAAMKHSVVSLTLNGAERQMLVPPGVTLLEVLRESQGLTGTRRGCEQGACGSCTVLVDGKPMMSCLLPAETIDGATVETIEGLTPMQGLHPIQEAFLDGFATQCGFCTSGMIMATAGLLAKNPDPIARRRRPRHLRQHLPLHRLRGDHRRGARRGPAHATPRNAPKRHEGHGPWKRSTRHFFAREREADLNRGRHQRAARRCARPCHRPHPVLRGRHLPQHAASQDGALDAPSCADQGHRHGAGA